MLDLISSFIHSSFATMAGAFVNLIVDGALVYVLVFLPKGETGFYRWHPIKRILAVTFFPLVLLYLLITACCCGDCCAYCHRCDDDD